MEQTMDQHFITTNDFIKLLKEKDPNGNKAVIIDGCFYYSPIEDGIIIKTNDKELIITY